MVNDYTLVNQTYINAITAYFDGTCSGVTCYDPGQGTNWHDAMKKVDDLGSADLVLFFTDGEPTGWAR
ncbi:MAG: hypothetical protein IPN60_02455 [Saprospiraceae bacterium]|nr:hypothetical protein [Candidatus Opimibacter skivensis]